MDIRVMRRILNRGQCEEVGGFLVDMQTANAIVSVYDALNEANRKRLVALPVETAARVAWKAIGRASK